MTAGRLLLIDGHSMAFRAFYALPDTMVTSSGQVTNAVYGFASMLARLLADEAPTHVAVAFDVSRHSFRTDRYPAYKGTRSETPEAFKGQVPLIKEVLSALNITSVELSGYEADDLLATLATAGQAAGLEVLVCSGDRDTLQLVTEHTTVLYPLRGVSDLKRFTPAEVEAKYGVPPQNYPDLAALVGEASDNLIGVPGVGPKTAAKWVAQYGGLEQLLAHAGEVKGKAGQSLRDHLDQVRLNRELNALVRDVALPLDVDALALRAFDRSALQEIANVVEFGGLRDRLTAVDPGSATAEPPAAEASDIEILTPPAGGLGTWLRASPAPVSLHVTGVFAPARGDAWTLAAARGDQAIVIDLQALSVDDDVALGEWLGDESTPKTLHGAKAAWHALKGRGYDLRGLAFDTELAAYLCYPDQRGYALGDLAVRHLGLDLSPDESGAQGALDLDGLGDNDATEQALTAVAIGRLAEVFTGELRDRAALGLLNELELPLTNVLAQMEHSGIAVDLDHLADLTKGFSAQVTAAAAEAYAAIGREVNLASPKQLQDVLFDQLGLPKTKKTKTGYTTDAAALQELFAKQPHPFLEALLAHREAAKLRATVEGLERSTLAGRIHTTFQQTVAATGRLSSTEPNLQNIPIRTEVGREIRKSFVVGAGFETLLTADYSQIEMRIMAHLSEDPGLIEAFEQGEDLHRYVGSRVFGVEPQDVGAEMRSKVKAMSYGLAYGLSAFGLSQQLGISPPEAQTLMDDYFTRFGHVHDYLQQVVAQARLSGYTETLLGRRRYLPDLNSENRQRRQMAERVATNAPIQGSAADLIKLAMLGVQREFTSAALGSRLLLQVHDELVVEVAPGELETVRQVVSTQMAGAYRLRVPLDVSVGIGRNWHAAAH